MPISSGVGYRLHNGNTSVKWRRYVAAPKSRRTAMITKEISEPPPRPSEWPQFANGAPAVRRERVREGLPHPRGATWDGKGTNFAVFSAHATKVEVCLFDEDGERELERIELPEYTNQIWHGYLPEVRPGTLYGYRVH